MAGIDAFALFVLAESLLVVLALLVAFKRVSVRFRDIEVTARDVAEGVRRVDKAVNNVPPGAPTLIERVTKLEELTEMHSIESRARLEAIEARLLSIEDGVAEVRVVVGLKKVV